MRFVSPVMLGELIAREQVAVGRSEASRNLWRVERASLSSRKNHLRTKKGIKTEQEIEDLPFI
jgi:hypothetical protein